MVKPILYYPIKKRGYIVCQGNYELTDPMGQELAEQWRMKWESVLTNLKVKECVF